MSHRIDTIRRHVASAFAALAISTFFIGAAVGPAVAPTGTIAQVEAQRPIA